MTTEDPYKYLADKLATAGVRSALIVDDAFDPIGDSVDNSQIEEFWVAIEREEAILSSLERLGVSATSAVDINEMALGKLWDARSDDTPLIGKAREYLFAEKAEAREILDNLTTFLADLDLCVATMGTNEECTSPPSLVFIDYYLGAGGEAIARNNAVIMARQIYAASLDGEEKPFFVLMSSRFNDGGQCEAESFRIESGLLKGLFDFATREELIDCCGFAVKLAIWTSDLSARHEIQKFVATLSRTMQHKSNSFLNRVLGLTISDYSYLQAMSLDRDGHPLGDYLVWLYGAILVNSVLEDNTELEDARHALNELSFNSFLPSPESPSPSLARAYSFALTEPISKNIDVHPHSPQPEGDSQDAEASNAPPEDTNGSLSCGREVRETVGLPLLRLGDLLINESNTLYMVATPDCDLMYSPRSERKLCGDQSVLLIPGELRPLNDNAGRVAVQTEPFFHNNAMYRIHWHVKKVMSMPVGQFFKWYHDNGYTRPVRLRQPYAMQIQHELAAGLGRVGTPATPPLYSFVDVSIFTSIPGNQWEPSEQTVAAGATVIVRGGRTSVVTVSTKCLRPLLRGMARLEGLYERAFAEECSAKKKQRLQGKLRKLGFCLKSPQALTNIFSTEVALPKLGKPQTLLGDVIALHRKDDAGADCSPSLVCLHFTCDED